MNNVGNSDSSNPDEIHVIAPNPDSSASLQESAQTAQQVVVESGIISNLIEQIEVAEQALQGQDLQDLNAALIQPVVLQDSQPQTTVNVTLTHLIQLDVSQYPHLHLLLAGGNQLRQLDISHNALLEELYVSSNALPELNISHNVLLEDFFVSNNALTELDISHNPRLVNLAACNNLLTELDVSNNPQLIELDIRFNRFERLHDSIFRLPRNCHVSAYDNRFSALYAEEIERTLAEVRERSHERLGPDIFYNIYDEAAALNADQTDLQQEVDSWGFNSTINLTVLNDDQKRLLGTYLAQLRETADYKDVVARPALTNRLERVLQLLSQNQNFRDKVTSIIDPVNHTCGDGIMVQFNDIEAQWHIYHKEHSLQELAEILARVQKHIELKSHAEKIAMERGLGDHAEIILHYQIQLKERLQLPISTKHMLYPFMASAITEEMIDEAELAINSSQIDLLSRSEFWREHLKKLDGTNATSFKAIEERFDVLMENAIENNENLGSQDYNNRLLQISKDKESALQELTKEITVSLLLNEMEYINEELPPAPNYAARAFIAASFSLVAGLVAQQISNYLQRE